MVKKLFFWCLLALTSIAITEAALYVILAHAMERPRIYEADPQLGWRVKPHLSLNRKHSSGYSYRIQTDAQGFRIGSGDAEPPKENTAYFLGDSFVFGQGVDIENRFDRYLLEMNPGYRVKNLGFPGYGTFQQILLFGDYLPDLKPGDIVVFVTSTNDFMDIQRKSVGGRRKPWLEFTKDGVVKRTFRLNLMDRLRDQSYIMGLLSNLIELKFDRELTFDTIQNKDWERGVRIYRELVDDFHKKLQEKGVRLGVVFHENFKFPEEMQESMGKFLEQMCLESGYPCKDISEYIFQHRDTALLPDLHWSGEGHRLVAAELKRLIEFWY